MISHHHECIFVHIPKCGGQSVETVFLEDLGLDWQTSAPLLLRPNRNPALGPPRLAHLSAEEYIGYRYVPEEMFHRYYKFTVVRNPWTRTVSLYRYSPFRGSFRKFVLRMAERPRSWWYVIRPQTEFLHLSGDIAVDDILRLESLAEDFKKVRSRLGLKAELPHANAGKDRKSLLPWRKKESHRNWQDFYDNETRGIIARLYEADFRALGYSFDR